MVAELKDVTLSDLFQDADVSRNLTRIHELGLHAQRAEFQENGIGFEFNVLDTGNAGPTIFVLHDDENAAFDAGLEAISQYGGRLVFLENDEARNFGNVDPNRIFGDDYPEYTEFIASLIERDGPVISFHTNADGHNRAVGAGTLSIHRYSDVYNNPEASITGYNHGGDEDDLVWVAADTQLSETPWATQFLEQMQISGINVVFEHVQGNDGSMSNWAAPRGFEYYNIEAQDGALDRMNAMVSEVFSAIGIIPRNEGSNIILGQDHRL